MILDLAPGDFAICRWPAGEALPDWVHLGGFVSVTRTPTELSAVCAAHSVPAGTARDAPWRMFVVRGPLDLSLTGVLASLLSPLADARVSIFAISTYDTDHVLVRAGDVDRAVDALTKAGHRVVGQA